ncbi:acyl-CoA carboxylase epsilon subunit [Actinotalea sp.]|uniref:acyl-CoA carboxylase epsilon subunit n=1 Tax=Actinotalea sp. TaxID=1872145 RepID=UPI0035618A55
MTPDVRVVRGDPDDVELAALVAGLAAGSAALSAVSATSDTEAEGRAARRRWQGMADRLDGGPTPGPDSWRWSRP